MDINELLSSLSPQDMATLQNLASSLGSQPSAQSPPPSGQSQPQPQPQPQPQSQPGAGQNTGNPLGSIDLNSLGSIASLMSKFSNTASDPRCNLILSLKPMLSPERQQRADEAIKIIKLIDMLPALRDSGLLKGVF